MHIRDRRNYVIFLESTIYLVKMFFFFFQEQYFERCNDSTIGATWKNVLLYSVSSKRFMHIVRAHRTVHKILISSDTVVAVNMRPIFIPSVTRHSSGPVADCSSRSYSTSFRSHRNRFEFNNTDLTFSLSLREISRTVNKHYTYSPCVI